MKIKKLYNPKRLPDYFVVEKIDGSYAMFYATPYREIKEDDLKPLVAYQPMEQDIERLPIARFYGLEIVEALADYKRGKRQTVPNMNDYRGD